MLSAQVCSWGTAVCVWESAVDYLCRCVSTHRRAHGGSSSLLQGSPVKQKKGETIDEEDSRDARRSAGSLDTHIHRHL